MIDWLLIYAILAGLHFRVLHHNRLVVPGMAKRGFVYWVSESWLRLVLIAVIFMLGSRHHGVIPESYRQWWNWYFRDHSLRVWILTPCTLTVALYLLMAITYRTNKDPHGYKMYDEGTGQPTYLRTSMRIPMIWFAIYWVWLLTSPWLPFYRCFVRSYLLRHRPAEVFPVYSYGLLSRHHMRPPLVPDQTPPPVSTNGCSR